VEVLIVPVMAAVAVVVQAVLEVVASMAAAAAPLVSLEHVYLFFLD
jgi:hypothetical protein